MGCSNDPNISLDDDCSVEQRSVSEYSPGIVGNGEVLLRQIFSPIHIDQETGEVKPAAFSDVKDKGLSTNRLRHISADAIVTKGEAKAVADRDSGKEREFLGIILAHCRNVRAIKSAMEEKRAFCVSDTARADDPSHADVCQVPMSKMAARDARRRLMLEFSKKPEMAPKRIRQLALKVRIVNCWLFVQLRQLFKDIKGSATKHTEG